jgi:hypothetical protein
MHPLLFHMKVARRRNRRDPRNVGEGVYAGATTFGNYLNTIHVNVSVTLSSSGLGLWDGVTGIVMAPGRGFARRGLVSLQFV